MKYCHFIWGLRLVPNKYSLIFWSDTYPIFVFFIGAYIREYIDMKKLNKKILVAIISISVFFTALFNFWKYYQHAFGWEIWSNSWSFQNIFNGVLIFLLINSFEYKCISDKVKKYISKISNLTLAAYLVSWTTDQIIYKPVINAEPIMAHRIIYYPITILIGVVATLLIAYIIQLLYNLLYYISRSVFNSKNQL